MTLVLVRSAPQSLWMLPGLWQVLYSLGIFASCRLLPRPMFGVAVFYLLTGLTTLAVAQGERALTPGPWGSPSASASCSPPPSSTGPWSGIMTAA